jgi:LysM repeat protein
MLARVIRNLLLLLLVIAVFAGVAVLITAGERQQLTNSYNTAVALAIDTAVYSALFDATRTVEAPLPQYRLIRLDPNQTLLEIALRFNTTVEAIRMANGLLPTVDSGNGEELVVPEGVQALSPPRRFEVYRAVDGDTLPRLAARFNIELAILELDNPVLTQRGMIPGDIVFVPELI